MEILDTTIATASLRHIAVRGAVAVGLGLALADFLIGRCIVQFGTRWLVLLQTVLWISTLIYVIATIFQAIFASRDVAMETRQAALCVFLLTGLLGAFAFTLIDLMSPGSFRASHGPVFAWADERSRKTEFMHLFVFGYATLSGSNCAEVAPATGFAWNAASLEAMAGQVFLAVVVARLVGLHVTPPRHTTGCRGRSLIICADYRGARFGPTHRRALRIRATKAPKVRGPRAKARPDRQKPRLARNRLNEFLGR